MSVVFRYEARGPTGRTERGSVEAATREEALARLYGRSLTPLSLEPDAARRAPARLSDRHARDLARALAQLLKSGLSLAHALRFAGEELEGAAAVAARHMREAAERGEPPSRALGGFAGAEARLLAGVLLAGETSGRLAEALEVAASSFARSSEMRARAATALIYPSFVILATMATLASFLFLVVPTLAGAFEGSEAALPQSTRDLLALSAWLQANGLIVLAGVSALVVVAVASPAVKGFLAGATDAVLLSPVGFGIAARLDFAAFAGLASLSLGAGVPAANAFDAAGSGMRSAILRGRMQSAVSAIRAGQRPSAAIAAAARPPKALVRLMQVGEETGQLADALKHAGELLSADSEHRLQRLGAIAGPIITLALGAVVASVVLSLFLGLLAMSDMATA